MILSIANNLASGYEYMFKPKAKRKPDGRM
jgi:hypothetical protein